MHAVLMQANGVRWAVVAVAEPKPASVGLIGNG